MADTSKLQRYQSEVASELSGLKLKDAEAEGANLIQLFLILAEVERDTELLPTNRAMFLIQTTHGWLLSEEEDIDLSDGFHVLLLRLFASLVIAVEGVAGSHWETCVDLAESVVEVSLSLFLGTYELKCSLYFVPIAF